jgi:hypothetical protein
VRNSQTLAHDTDVLNEAIPHHAGKAVLTFTTVEHLDSANPPLPLPDHVRME